MRRSRLAAVLVALVALIATVFATGYVASQAQTLEPTWASIGSWMGRFGLLTSSASRGPLPPSQEAEELFMPFWEAWDLIGREFYDETAIDADKLFQGAIRGMVGALGDPFTLYLDPHHRELTEAELRGTFEGIGVQVEMTERELRIVAPLAGSPGERAGLRPADSITHVDGQNVRGMDLAAAIRLIRGPAGSSVTLTVQRNGREPFDVTVVREQIRIEAVRGDIRPDNVAYVRITTFTGGVGSQLRSVLDRLQEGAPIGWVLDLRGNPGGTLEGAITVTSLFLEDGVVLYEQRRDGELREIQRRGDARAASGPMAVLVDRGSASASEIVAAALRDNGRAVLIGEQTFGKGLVQVIHRLSDDSALRLTIARWLTPGREAIQGAGLVPQIVVEAQPGEDAALAEAVAYVRAQQAAGRPSAAVPGVLSLNPAGRWAGAEVALLEGPERQEAGSPGFA